MPAERYYFPSTYTKDEEISLEGQEFHHLVNVMRTRKGERVELVNGNGQRAEGTVVSLEKKRAVILIEHLTHKEDKGRRLILAQGIPRFARLEYILEKGTELGMTEIWLFPGMHSEKGEFSANQQERMQTILVSAMKQCGRLYLPKLSILPALKKWKDFPSNGFFGDVHPEAPRLNPTELESMNEVIFFIGPESGFDKSEVEVLRQHHIRGVTLHHNILRTDTAAIVALALCSQ